MNDIALKIQEALRAGLTPAFAYDRVSSMVQEVGVSLDYQVDHAERYAEYSGLKIVHFFTVVESARNPERKAFSQMIDLAFQYGVKDLIFKNTDRMSRNYHDLLKIEELYDKHGFRVHLYQAGRVLSSDSSYSDRFIMNVETAAARHLSDKLSHDIKEAHKYKASLGVAHNSPIGYKYDKDKMQHVIDEQEREVVELIHRSYDVDGLSIPAIVDLLNVRGYVHKRGHSWHRGTVHKILVNPFYHGQFEYKGSLLDGTQETYYDKAVYDKRVELLQSKNRGRYGKINLYPYNGLLTCSLCGRAWFGEMKKGKYLYYTHPCSEGRVYLPASVVDSSLDGYVKSLEFVPEFLDLVHDIYRQISGNRQESRDLDRSLMNRQVQVVNDKIKKLIDIYSDDKIDRSLVAERINQLKKERARVTQEFNSIEIEYDDFHLALADMIRVIKKFPSLFHGMNAVGRGEFLGAWSDRVELSPSGESSISWIEPVRSLLIGADIVRIGDGMWRDGEAMRTTYNSLVLWFSAA